MNITTIIYHSLGGLSYVIRQEKQIKISDIEKEKAKLFFVHIIHFHAKKSQITQLKILKSIRELVQ